MIPRADFKADAEAYGPFILEAVHRVLESGRFIGGEEVEQLEAEIAVFLGVQHVVALGSGTDALTIGLMALQAEPGEVITTPLSFVATASAIVRAGHTPKFVDVDPDSLCLDPKKVLDAITPETRAIIPVHLYGHPMNISWLKHMTTIPIIEDACQAFGGFYGPDHDDPAQIGTVGDMGAFSLFPTKPLGCYGDGGFLVTNDSRLADIARILCNNGCVFQYVAELAGFNSRLDAIQAAIARVKLPHTSVERLERSYLAQRYHHGLLRPDLTRPTPMHGHAWHQYVIRVESRDALQERLQEHGIESVPLYPVPLHRMQPFWSDETLPVAERACETALAIPIFAGMTQEQQERVIEAVCP